MLAWIQIQVIDHGAVISRQIRCPGLYAMSQEEGHVVVNSVSVTCVSVTQKRHGSRNWKSYNYSVLSFFIVL